MAMKVKAQKFDTTNKATLKLGKGVHTRTGASADRNKKTFSRRRKSGR